MVLGEGGGDMLHHIGSRDQIGAHGSVSGQKNASSDTDALREHIQSVDRSRELSIVDIGCSAHFFCKLDDQGRVWTWGIGPMVGRRKSIDMHARASSLSNLLASAAVQTLTAAYSRSVVAGEAQFVVAVTLVQTLHGGSHLMR